MSDDDAKVRELIEQYGDAPQSTDASVQEFRKMLRHFLENGPGTREERRRILMRNMVELHEEYKGFLDERS